MVKSSNCRKGRLLAEATNLARDMVNEPANYMTPTHMAEKAKRMGGTYGLELAILERGQMEELGMGALLGVAQGAGSHLNLLFSTIKGWILLKLRWH
jgi:leucyl aminopeptidase